MSLIAYIASELSLPIIRQSWLRGTYVRALELMSCAQCVFETGTVLGWTFRNKMPLFVQLFSEPGREADVLEYLRNKAADRLAASGQEPSSFWDLYGRPEVTRRFGDLNGLLNSAKVKVWLKAPDLWSQLAVVTSEGIGFGSTYADIAERLLEHQIDQVAWKDARSQGLDLPFLPPNYSPKERRSQALSLVKPYVAGKRPDLQEALGL
jgi:hypothetical protein